MEKTSWTCPDCDRHFASCVPPVEHRCGRKVRVYRQPSTLITQPNRLVSTEQLIKDAIEMCSIVESDSIIVGVSRSGVLPASVIATHLHCPLFTLDQVTGDICDIGSGKRAEGLARNAKNVYVVDDSMWSGKACKRSYELASNKFAGKTVHHLSVYGNPRTSVPSWAYVHKMYDTHFFEWNYLNTFLSTAQAYDLDGVLCRDFTPEEDDDGELYIEAMRAMKPCHNRPLRQGVRIITARLEKYREATEEWLQANGFNVELLVMGPWNTKEERSRVCIGSWKADMIHEHCGDIHRFIESCPVQAKVIAEKADRTVICNTTGDIHMKSRHQAADDADAIIEHLEASGVTKDNAEKVEGLGDLVHAALNMLGITEERFKAALNLKECKCTERRKFLNKLVPFL